MDEGRDARNEERAEECSGLAPRRGCAFGAQWAGWKALARAGAARPSRRAGEDAVGAHMRGKNPCRVFVAGIGGNVGRRRRHQAAGGGVKWLTSKTISVPVSLLQRRPCIRPYLCAQIQRAQVPLHGRHEHSAWINRLVRPALLALYCMPGSQCCFAECIAMCAWRAHVCILSCGVLLMLA